MATARAEMAANGRKSVEEVLNPANMTMFGQRNIRKKNNSERGLSNFIESFKNLITLWNQ